MVTIQSGSIEVEDGDTISVDGSELTLRDTGEIELPNGETLISLSDINGNDISPASVDATELDVSNINAVELDVDSAIVGNQDLLQYITDLQTNIAETRFSQGLEKLNYDGGVFDVLEDESLVDTKTDVEGFTGSVTTISTADYGQFSSPFQTLGFTPTSVVIGHDADERGSVVAENGAQFEYGVADGESVEDATLKMTGSDSTSDESRSWSGVEDGESINFEVSGTKEADLVVNMSGGGSGGSEEWSKSTGSSGVNSDVSIADGGVAAAGSDGVVYYYNLSDGSEEWTFDTTGGYIDAGGPVIDSGIVVVPDGEGGNLYGIDLSTGNEEWSYSLSASVTSGIAIDSGTVVFGDDNGNVYGIDLSTGNEEWSYSTGASSVDSGVAIDSGVAVVGDNNAVINGIDISTGNEEWTYSTSYRIESGIAIDSDTVVAGDADGNVYGVDLSTGNEVWGYDTQTQVQSGIAIDSGTVVLADIDNDAYGISLSDGSEEWTHTTESTHTVESGIDIYSGVAVYGNDGGEIIALSVSDGTEEWTYSAGVTEVQSGIAIDSGVAIAGDNNGDVNAIGVLGSAFDPAVTIDGQTASQSGELGTDETYTETLSGISTGSYSELVSLSDGGLDISLSWTETTETVDPSVEIATDDGVQTIEHTGTLSSGQSVDLSDSIDESLIGGTVTVSVTVSDTVTSPVGQVGLEYRHEGFDAGGIVKYTIEDSDGNSVTLEDDEQVDVSFTSSDVKITPQLQNGLATAELYDYAVYFQ